MSKPDHYIVRQPVSEEIKVKRSLFIAHLAPAAGKEEAEQVVDGFRRRYHDATHNCYAYRVDQDQFRYSDDGEPSGTAGKPILQVIDKHGLIRTVLVVTRYFGGIKLGTGGLIRAYSEAAEAVVQKAELEKYVHYHSCNIEFPYNSTRMIHHLLEKYQGMLLNPQYGSAVTAELRLPEQSREEFFAALLADESGQIRIWGSQDDAD